MKLSAIQPSGCKLGLCKTLARCRTELSKHVHVNKLHKSVYFSYLHTITAMLYHVMNAAACLITELEERDHHS